MPSIQITKNKSYTHEDVVRDYECDAQGIVNNAVYMNYCEHARNLCITALGHNIHSLHQIGETPVVSKCELHFQQSLTGGNRFCIHTQISKKGTFKLIFSQKITRDDVCCTTAIFTVAILNTDKKPIPISQSIFAPLFAEN